MTILAFRGPFVLLSVLGPTQGARFRALGV